MTIREVRTGILHEIDINPIEKHDYNKISKTRYFFNWSNETAFENYKLTIKGSNDILGIISIERIPEEWRIHIRLLTVSKENKGSDKEYENIAGNLIVFVAIKSVLEFGEMACISLKPKSAIIKHYKTKYKMRKTGMTLSLEFPEIFELINEYNN